MDLLTLTVALLLLIFGVFTAFRTRSPVIRFALLAVVIVIVALMLWNLATHGGLHAV